MHPKNLAAGLNPLERKVLAALIEPKTTLPELVETTGLKEIEIMRAIQWLSNKKLVTIQEQLEGEVTLEKPDYAQSLPEWRIYQALDKPKTRQQLIEETNVTQQEFGASLGILKRINAITVTTENDLTLSKNQNLTKYAPQDLLQQQFPINPQKLSEDDKTIVSELAKRGIVKNVLHKRRLISITHLGEQTKSQTNEHLAETLTSEDLKTGTWKTKQYRRFDVEINVPSKPYGKRHFVADAEDYIRSIWLSLGFEEMQGTMIQTAFWNLDSLFVPQNHPARALQDTFYLSDPATGKLPDLKNKVKAMHEHGGDIESTGWQTSWSEKEASKLMLRTHTTVISAQTLAKLKEGDLPKKYFTIGKDFRNEALDWKHLFEFYQIDGIVVAQDLTLANLVGYMKTFFKHMGFPDIRIRPGYFPYVEPGLEVDVYHPTKKEWVEFGGAGIFRPEVVIPLFGKWVTVLAWGLGLERSITDYYAINDLRDIYKNDLAHLRSQPKWLQ